jgi:hypothetical protein
MTATTPVRRAQWRLHAELNLFAPWRLWPIVQMAANADVTRWMVSVLFLQANIMRTMVEVPSLQEVRSRES